MKFAFCIFKYFPFGGLERDFKQIVDLLIQRNHQIDVYTMKWEGEIPKEINVILVPFSGHTNHGRCNSFVKNLQPMLKKNSYDLVIGFNRMPNLDLYYAADICYKKDVSERHGFLYKLTNRYRIYSKFEKAIFSPNAKTKIMYLADMVKKQYIECYGTQEERFFQLSPGISIKNKFSSAFLEKRKLIRKELGITNDAKLILQIGSDYHRKAVDRTIRALASIPLKNRNNFKLAVAGKGKVKKYLDLANRFTITKNIFFLGEQKNIKNYLAAADYFIHPARREAAGLVIVEAIVAGIPVIVTGTCGYSNFVTKARCGVVASEPFDQATFNQEFLGFLNSTKYNDWKENAINYGKNEWLYDRLGAVEYIEDLAKFL